MVCAKTTSDPGRETPQVRRRAKPFAPSFPRNPESIFCDGPSVTRRMMTARLGTAVTFQTTDLKLAAAILAAGSCPLLQVIYDGRRCQFLFGGKPATEIALDYASGELTLPARLLFEAFDRLRHRVKHLRNVEMKGPISQ